MEKFAQFGIEPVLLLAQVVNFLILFVLLKRFLYKPILGMLKKREEKIREGLAAGEKGETLLAKAKAEEKEVLAKAGNEAKAMLEETKVRAAKMEEELLASAKEESEHMMAIAKNQIEQERAEIEKQLEKKAAESGLRMLEAILPKVLTRDDHMRILEGSEKMLRKALS